MFQSHLPPLSTWAIGEIPISTCTKNFASFYLSLADAVSVLKEKGMSKILDFELPKATGLIVTEFLDRTKFESKLDHGCQLRAEREQRDK